MLTNLILTDFAPLVNKSAYISKQTLRELQSRKSIQNAEFF
jgi:hypothetical protein